MKTGLHRECVCESRIDCSVTYPTRIRRETGMNLASVAEPAVASSHRGGRNQLKPRYTPVEDRMILQAIEIHGRNWRNVLKVLRDHHEVLGEEIGPQIQGC